MAALVAAHGCQDIKLNDAPEEQFHDEQAVNLENYFGNHFDNTSHKENEKDEADKEDEKHICLVDLSNNFIPPLLRLSKYWGTYFTTDGPLADQFERERLGIFSSFEHHKKPFQHYKKAIERRGDEEQPKIEGFAAYISEKDIRAISRLESQIEKAEGDRSEKRLAELNEKVDKVKDIQKILFWEGFYDGEINGVYDHKTTRAVISYQKHHLKLRHKHFHINNLIYVVQANGRVDKATKELMNKNLEDYAVGGIRRVLEERIFHMRCLFGGSVKSPSVIEQKELDKLTAAAAEQTGLDSLEGIERFFRSQPNHARVKLEIPERYKRDHLKLEIEIEKWSSKKRKHPSLKTKLIIYSVEDEGRMELFRARAVVGGWNKVKGQNKFFNTPEGRRYIKSQWIMPYWTPPKWSGEEKGDPVTLPGPYNAFGMSAMVLHLTDKEPENIFRGWYNDDDGIRNHLTPWPSSLEYGGFSHGCVRIHPEMSRAHFFITRFTPHTIVLEKGNDGEQYLKFTALKGSFIPYKPEHYVPVNICKEKCK